MKRFLPIYILLLSFSLSSQNLTDNLLLHYTFDENSADVSGNSYDGIPNNIGYGVDRFGNLNGAAYFNGVDSYVNFPNISALKPSFPMSFAFWINYTSDLYNHQVVFNTSYEENRCTGVWFNSSLNNNAHAINFGDGTYSYSPNTRSTFLCYKAIQLNQWHLITAVINSATDMKIYIDCTPQTGEYSGFGGDLVYSSTPGCIGRHDRNLLTPADYFEGFIDDFMYWDRALTDGDVSNLCSLLANNQLQSIDKNVLVYPNPALDFINIETRLEGVKSIYLYNFVGQMIYSGAFKSSLDVRDFSPGIYQLVIKCDNKVISQKIIIN